jgi:hypothetical protein
VVLKIGATFDADDVVLAMPRSSANFDNDDMRERMIDHRSTQSLRANCTSR